ncbi:MAG: LacI family DNA-binding transcriptional regulator [Acidobacteriaceae bacterium]|nr:LacI family DNA-binding transcriptional regulator [Acidobacteriaceae bacterium]
MKTSRTSSPTITDIARQLGISAMTVSRALTGKAEVSSEMRERVTRCAEMLGYRPNRWARSLVTRQSYMIGVVIPEIAHSFFADCISGIEEVLDKANYDLLLCHSRSDPKRERAEIQTLVGGHIDGLIVASVQPMRSPELFSALKAEQVPFVLFDRYFPGAEFSSVRLDDLAAGRLAAEFLTDLGHKRIAHIAGPTVSPAILRRRGFLQAMKSKGLSVPADLIVRAPFTTDGGRRTTVELVARKPRPTAIFAANDPLALGAICACREAGLRVPEDISVMGAGNVEGSYHPSPFLTTIDWPRQELGRIAAAFVLGMLSHPGQHAAREHVFEPKVLPRYSTGRLRTK